jgi:16S rRNA processing protein RimM
MADRPMVTVGRIVRPHGNKGHVVVAPETDFGAERFAAGATLYGVRAEKPALRVVASREHQGRWVVGFDGVTTIDAAEALRDLELSIPAEELKPLGPGGYYAHDLAGCAVENPAGRKLGRVESVLLGSGVPLLVLETEGGEVLVPLAEEICRRIDVAAKLIVIDPPDGLLELNDLTYRKERPDRSEASGPERAQGARRGAGGPADKT